MYIIFILFTLYCSKIQFSMSLIFLYVIPLCCTCFARTKSWADWQISEMHKQSLAWYKQQETNSFSLVFPLSPSLPLLFLLETRSNTHSYPNGSCIDQQNDVDTEVALAFPPVSLSCSVAISSTSSYPSLLCASPLNAPNMLVILSSVVLIMSKDNFIMAIVIVIVVVVARRFDGEWAAKIVAFYGSTRNSLPLLGKMSFHNLVLLCLALFCFLLRAVLLYSVLRRVSMRFFTT